MAGTVFTITNPGSSPDRGGKCNVVNSAQSATDNTAHPLVDAPTTATLRTYLGLITVSNTGASFADVVITDGQSTLHIPAPAGGGAIVPLPLNAPFISKPGTAITFQASAATTTLFVSCQGYQGP
jgi:hypothetical protein